MPLRKRRRIDGPAETEPDPVEQVEATVVKRQPSSAFVGVSWDKQKGRWLVLIRHDGKAQHLGYFADEEGVVRVFDDVARWLPMVSILHRIGRDH
eukprot:COSAG04_NODE_2381_length_4233_cov_38.831640_5_plen_95_part_00